MKKPGLEKWASRDLSLNHFDAQTPDGSSVSLNTFSKMCSIEY